jgi:tRNA(adenine34) deaminase
MALAETGENDLYWMTKAYELAQQAAEQGEVPVGAVLVDADNQCIGEGWNQPITGHDPTAHAEIVAIRNAANLLGNYRLPGTTLYVTLEPCPMCAGAIIHARISRVVIATPDPRSGCAGSVYNLLDTVHFNHRAEITMGVLQHECSSLIKAFFLDRRKNSEN